MRTRRRLVGAAALLLAVVIVLPMVLDPTPRPVPDNVVIDIPGEKTPFAPRLSLPASAEPAKSAAAGTPHVSARQETPNPVTSEAPAPPAAEQKRNRADVPAKTMETAAAAPAAKSVEKPAATAAKSANGSKYVLQAAALGSDAAAQNLAGKLKKAGFVPYTEKIQTKEGPRVRVRVGPYSTRDDAERVKEKLKALGVNAAVVTD